MTNKVTCFIERLYHFQCRQCQAWWTQADAQIKENDTVYCSKCGTPHKVTSFEIGEEVKVVESKAVKQDILDAEWIQLEIPL